MAKKTSSAAAKHPVVEPRGRILAVGEALDALRRLQQLSVNRGLDALTDEEIEAEIRAVRAKRRRA
jgi:hypothetical protein